jgi:uncharacterized protein
MKKSQLDKIELWLKACNGTITAFSGGIDSALVLFLSRKYLGKEKAIGVISASESLKDKDHKIAVDFCTKHDIELVTIKTKELADKNYNTNPSNRCYFCKTHLYTELNTVKEKYPNYEILNGTNKDDFGDYRPGLTAANENNIKSPLAELNFTKHDIRELAKYLGIEIWDKPASPCLSSRIPYGYKITSNKLKQIEEAEEILNSFGFSTVRVRHYGDLCKIEVPKDRIDELKLIYNKISSEILTLGFENCIIDKEGLVSGNLNKVLNLKK